jgi:hypothetical protein
MPCASGRLARTHQVDPDGPLVWHRAYGADRGAAREPWQAAEPRPGRGCNRTSGLRRLRVSRVRGGLESGWTREPELPALRVQLPYKALVLEVEHDSSGLAVQLNGGKPPVFQPRVQLEGEVADEQRVVTDRV